MNVVARATLVSFWERHPETEQPLKDWYRAATRSQWTRMNDVIATFPKAKSLNAERVRFAICGGNYRLIVAFKFTARIAFVKFVGSHSEYARIDALTVSRY
jgi:mRNA interferase HigB